MSIIVGAKYEINDKIFNVIGCDSLISGGGTICVGSANIGVDKANSKIFKAIGVADTYIGVAGYSAAADIIQYFDFGEMLNGFNEANVGSPKKKYIDHEVCTKALIPFIRNELIEQPAHIYRDFNDFTENSKQTLIIMSGPNLLECSLFDTIVCPVDGCIAAGTGKDFAKGAFMTMKREHTTGTPKDIAKMCIYRSIRIAEMFDTACGGDINLFVYDESEKKNRSYKV